MCVASEATTSASREVNIEVPQGSVFGPILFWISMNNLKDNLRDNGTFRLLYADDLQIYVQVPINEIDYGIFRFSESAKRVSEWAQFNCLSLNTKKTQAIVFGKKIVYIDQISIFRPKAY